MPQNTQEILRAIQSDNDRLISVMLHDLITRHGLDEGGPMQAAYDRYKQDRVGVPIYQKAFQNYEKVHERIPNDFFGDIVDLKTGYMGNEIVITVDTQKVPNKAEADRDAMFLQDFQTRESLTDTNSELVKMAATCGKCYRLLYVAAGEGTAKVMNSFPWETALYYDGSLPIPVAGMRYYTVDEASYDIDRNRTEHKKRYRVEWYDEQFITYYRENDDGIFILDKSQPPDGDFALTGQQPHYFNGIPILEFKNNEEDKGEAAKVLELIDGYDAIISDATSEVEQLRMAYMWARGAGMKLDEDFEDALRQTGIWPLPENGEIGFASKDLGGAAGFVVQLLGEIRRNIYSFSKSMDLSQDKGGDMRVIGWQIALLRLEMSAQVTERKFKKAYRRQYQLLSDFWRTNNVAMIDPMALKFVFTRKFPKDIDQELDMLIKAMDALPLEDAYALTTFIENPKELAEKFREERPELQIKFDEELNKADSITGIKAQPIKDRIGWSASDIRFK